MSTDTELTNVKPCRVRAKQLGDIPHYPVENLYPCYMTEGIEWKLAPAHLLSAGILVTLDGTISYAPAMVARMKIDTFRVWVQCDTYGESTEFQLRLRYFSKDEKAYEQYSAIIDGYADRFMFEIPIEHIDQKGWFACAVSVELKTPMTGVDLQAALNRGMQEPQEPVLVRGCWLEVNG